ALQVDPARIAEVRLRADSAAWAVEAQLVYRTPAQVAELFDDLELLEPGILDVAEWARLDLPVGVTGPEMAPLPEVLWRLGGIGRLA
ncbi:MAG: S-adenosyl methyltransferase, partial [Pseudonocardiales bacterium]|nr:S-adenosyl methyltransferase [Pseudonocardiales bacterium]